MKSTKKQKMEKIKQSVCIANYKANNDLTSFELSELLHRKKHWLQLCQILENKLVTSLGFDPNTDYFCDENEKLLDVYVPYNKNLQKQPIPLDMYLFAKFLRAPKFAFKHQGHNVETELEKKNLDHIYFLSIIDGKPVIFLQKTTEIYDKDEKEKNLECKKFSIAVYAILSGKYPINLYRIDSNHKHSTHPNKFKGTEKLVNLLLCEKDDGLLQEKIFNFLQSTAFDFSSCDFCDQHEHWYNILTTILFPECIGHDDICKIEKPLTYKEAKARVKKLFSFGRIAFKTNSQTTIKDLCEQIKNAENETLKHKATQRKLKNQSENKNDD